jgi:glucose/arabinose dehydrogenase
MEPTMRRLALLVTIACSVALPVGAQQSGPAARSPTPRAIDAPIRAVKVADGLEHPWAIEFLPDGRIIVTERPGRVRIVAKDGSLSKPLAGVPEVYARGQGGLLDIALSPRFAEDRLVYLSYAEPGEGGQGTAVARARLAEDSLQNLQVIWRQAPKVDARNHWGSRLLFAKDGTLFVTLGDRFSFREEAQNLANTIGKIVRINADGSIPKDNPFIGRPNARPEIWSYGHRNVQAAALDPRTGALWIVMHGARGGDELDQPQAGKNYGWPVITYGRDYSGASIGIGTAKEGLEQPAYYWDPVIAPSGAEFYTGDRFPEWKGDLFVGSLTPGALVRLRLEAGKVVREERYLGDVGRVRDVRQGPDGFLYLAIDSRSAPILRVEPLR